MSGFIVSTRMRTSCKRLHEGCWVKASKHGWDYGWWWQQLLKIGAEVCIMDISENFCVWDADLIHARALAAGKEHRFFPTEFCVELLQEQFMTAIYNDLSGGTLRWSKESNLGRIAFASAAMSKLWSNFYNNVLLPAGEQKKLRMRPARTLLKKYLTALDGHSFTELAKLNGVKVMGRVRTTFQVVL